LHYVEFGKENNNIILLLHGGGLSWWNYEDVAKSLQKDYHVILPILDGHAKSEKPFTSIEDNADEIINFIDAHLGGSVFLIGGLSLGGQILLEILSQRNDICKYAIIESALVIPSKLTYSMIKPAFGSCYGLIQYKWFSKLQFKSLKIKPDLFDCYFRDTCAISKNDMIAFLQANSLYSLKKSIKNCTAKVYIFVGERENIAIQKSAKIIHQALPESVLHVLPELYHGEFSINKGIDYANKIREINGY
jgi:pimeloyl-ACP methyl ester carboxylesterase